MEPLNEQSQIAQEYGLLPADARQQFIIIIIVLSLLLLLLLLLLLW